MNIHTSFKRYLAILLAILTLVQYPFNAAIALGDGEGEAPETRQEAYSSGSDGSTGTGGADSVVENPVEDDGTDAEGKNDPTHSNNDINSENMGELDGLDGDALGEFIPNTSETMDITGTITLYGLPGAQPGDLVFTLFVNGTADYSRVPAFEQLDAYENTTVWRYTLAELPVTDELSGAYDYALVAEGTIAGGILYIVESGAAREAGRNPLPANADLACVGLISIGGAYRVERGDGDPEAAGVSLALSTLSGAPVSGQSDITLDNAANSWSFGGLPGFDPLNGERVEYCARVMNNAEGYVASYENDAEYAYDGGLIVNRYTVETITTEPDGEGGGEPVVTDPEEGETEDPEGDGLGGDVPEDGEDGELGFEPMFTPMSVEPTFEVKSTTDKTMSINWNDNNDDGNKRPTDTSAFRPTIMYDDGTGSKPLTADVLMGWGYLLGDYHDEAARKAEIEARLNAAPNTTGRDNYWDYTYKLPSVVTMTEEGPMDEEGQPTTITTTINISYNLEWNESAFTDLEDSYFVEDKAGEANTRMCTLKSKMEFNKSWKDGGDNTYRTRAEAEVLLEKLTMELFYSKLGQNHLVETYTLSDYYKIVNPDPNDPVVKLVEDGNVWKITVSNLPAHMPDGSVLYCSVTEAGGVMDIAAGSAFDGEDVIYTATYQNVGNRAEDSSACYDGGTITNTLTDDVEIKAKKVWQDDGEPDTVAARPKGKLKLNRYPVDGVRVYGNASPVSGAEISLITTNNEYDIDFSTSPAGTNVFPRFDIDGYEYVYLVKEVLDEGGYTRIYEYPGVDEADNPSGDAVYNGGTMYNRRTGEIDLSVTKRWEAAARQDLDSSVTLLLERRMKGSSDDYEEVEERTISGFRAEIIEKETVFGGLPQFDDEGLEYEYRVSESSITVGGTTVNLKIPSNTYVGSDNNTYCVIDGYTYRLEQETDLVTGNVKLTNTLVGETEVYVQKVWDGIAGDGDIDDLDTVTIYLQRDGSLVGSSEAKIEIESDGTPLTSFEIDPEYAKIQKSTDSNQDGDWLKITGLERYDERGMEHKYVVTEKSVDGYNRTYSTDRDELVIDGKKVSVVRTTVTNTPGTEGAHIVARKEWLDYGDESCRGPVLLDVYHTTDDGTTWDFWKQAELNVGNDWEVWISCNFGKTDSLPGDLNRNNYYVVEAAVHRGTTDYDLDPIVTDEELFNLNDTYKHIGSITTDAHKYESYAKVTINTDVNQRYYYDFKNIRVGTVNIDLFKDWNDDGYEASIVNQKVTLEVYRRLVYETEDVFLAENFVKTVELDVGDKISDVLDPNNGMWTDRIDDLPKYDEDGVPYYYAVRETKVTETDANNELTVSYNSATSGHYELTNGQQYSVSIKDDRIYGEHRKNQTEPEPDEYDFTVTNARAATINVEVYKVWKDVMRDIPIEAVGGETDEEKALLEHNEELRKQNEKQNRPDIYFVLYQATVLGVDSGTGEDIIGPITPVYPPREVRWTTTDDDDYYGTYHWKGEFTDLRRYDDNGKEYKYFVREGNSVMGEYVTEYYSSEAFVPSHDFSDITTKTVYDVNSADLLWASDSTDEEKYVPQGGTIVNIRKGSRYLTGKKVWENMPEGLNSKYFPEVSFLLKIFVDEVGDYNPALETYGYDLIADLNSEKTQFSFREDVTDGALVEFLEKYDEYGVTVRYRAEEMKGGIEGHPNGFWTPVYDDYNLAVINEYNSTPQDTVDVKVTKKWDVPGWVDPDEYPTATLELWRVLTNKDKSIIDEEGARERVPDEELEASYTNPGSTLTKTFTGLNKYGYNGNPFHYYFVEELNGYDVTGWGKEPSEDLDNTTNFEYIVLNTHTGIDRGLIKLHGTKQWSDNSDKFGLRPANESALDLRVYRAIKGSDDLEDITSMVTINWLGVGSDGNWTYTVNANNPSVGGANPVVGKEEYTLYRYSPTGEEYVYYVGEDYNSVHYVGSIISGTNASGLTTDSDDLVAKGGAPDNEAINIGFRNTLQTTTVSVTKKWLKYIQGGATTPLSADELAMVLPDSVTFKVQWLNGSTWEDLRYEDTSLVTTTKSKNACITAINAGGVISFTPTNTLPKFDANGDSADYRLVEYKIGTVEVSGGKAGGFDVDNNDDPALNTGVVTNTLQTNALTIRKTFDDDFNNDGIRPTKITFTIERDNDPSKTITVDLDGGGTTDAWAVWGSPGITVYVPKFQADGSAFSTYDVTEGAITGYTLFEPDIGNWTKKDPDPTTGDHKTFEFKNTHASGVMSVEVKKSWSDGAAALVGGVDKTRPNTIGVKLQYRMSNKTLETDWKDVPDNWLVWENHTAPSVTLSQAAGVWDTHTWVDLPCRSNESGTHGEMLKYQYRVVEEAVTGYTTTYSPSTYLVDMADATGTITINNTLDTVSLPVSKVWKPFTADNEFARNPEIEVMLQYYNDGSSTWDDISSKTLVFNETDGWSGTFTGLPERNNSGDLYQYRVRESKIGGDSYNDAVSQYSYNSVLEPSGVTVTNTLVKRTHGITVKKLWDDENNQDGIRHSSVSVQLVRDAGDLGEKYESDPVPLNEGNGWTTTWNNLPKYQSDGVTECEYTVVETLPNDTRYSVKYSIDEVDNTSWKDSCVPIPDDADTIVTVKNSYTPKTMALNVTKAWDDQNDRFGLRPPSVKVRLMSTTHTDGITDASAVFPGVNETLTGTPPGSYTWTNLPVMDDGKVIYYSVQELDASGNPVAPSIIKAYQAPAYDYTATGNNAVVKKSVTDDEVSIGGHIDDADGTTHNVEITNALDDVKLTVKKDWDDHENIYTSRPDSLTFALQRRVKGIGDFVAVEDENGAITLVIEKTDALQEAFDNLPRYDASNKEYEYRAVETHYNYGSGEVAVTLNTANVPTSGWFEESTHKYEFTTETVYNGVTGYTSTITNELILETISLSGKKTWDDEGDYYGTRPTDITIKVYYKDISTSDLWTEDTTGTITWKKDEVDDEWSYTVTPLQKYTPGYTDDRVYAVVEDSVEYYEVNTTEHEGTVDVDGNFIDVNFTNTMAGTVLAVTKVKENAPDTPSGPENSLFTFKVYVSQELMDDDNPGILYIGGYEKFGKDDPISPLSTDTGTAGATGEIRIKADEKFVLRNLPVGYYYRVVEEDHADYELVDDDCVDTKGTLTTGLNSALFVNKTKVELAINNETENKGTGDTNAGGKVIVVVDDNFDIDEDGEESIDGFKENKVTVAWVPDEYWTYGDTFSITYTKFNDPDEPPPEELILMISDYLNDDGTLKLPSQWDYSGGNGSENDFPDIKLERDPVTDVLLLTLANNADKMPRQVQVNVKFVPTLAVSNVTENNEHGKVKVEGGSAQDQYADGAPVENEGTTATGSVKTPYRATSVYAYPESGYILDRNNIFIRNMDDYMRDDIVQLVVASDGTFSVELNTFIAGVGATVTVKGKLVSLDGDNVMIVFDDPLPVPLQVDVQFITKPKKPSGDDKNDGSNLPGGVYYPPVPPPYYPQPHWNTSLPGDGTGSSSDIYGGWGSGGSYMPQTGDDTPIVPVIVVGVLSAAAAIALFVTRKKRGSGR